MHTLSPKLAGKRCILSTLSATEAVSATGESTKIAGDAACEGMTLKQFHKIIPRNVGDGGGGGGGRGGETAHPTLNPIISPKQSRSRHKTCPTSPGNNSTYYFKNLRLQVIISQQLVTSV